MKVYFFPIKETKSHSEYLKKNLSSKKTKNDLPLTANGLKDPSGSLFNELATLKSKEKKKNYFFYLISFKTLKGSFKSKKKNLRL